MLNLDISGSLHIDNSLIVQNLDVYQKLIDLSNNGTNGGSGSGIFTQSGSIYYYDSTSLGIGTSDVSENYALTISGGLYLTGTSSLSYITPSWLNDASSNLYIEDINTLGIGTNYNDLSFDNQLDVSGNVYFRNNLIVDNILMLNGINVYNKLNESNIDSTTDISVNHLDVSGTLKVQNLDIYQKVIDLSNVISSSSGGSSSSIELFKFSMVRSNSVITFYNSNLLTFVNLDRQTSGLNMSSNGGTITFAGSNVTGTWEIKYSLIISNSMSTTSRINIRAYLNGLWVAEWGKLNGSMEDGNFIVDVADGDTLEFKPIALQGSNALYVDTGLTTETYDACVLYGVKLY